jgi:putative adenylate-forming enzyme
VVNILQGIRDYRLLNRHLYRFSDEQIRAYQLSELQKLVAFSMKHSRFYGDLYKGLPVGSLEDFRQLPSINKQIMMDHFDDINTCGLKLSAVRDYAVQRELHGEYLGYYQDQYVIGLSSGTSGNKGIYITPKSMTERLPFVFLARSGLSSRDLPFRILFLLRVFSQGFEDINAPLIHLNYLSTMTPVHEIIRQINDDRINILMAPPSLVRQLLPWAGTITRPLKMIVSYAEVLEKEEKERFRRSFGTRVIEIYQASEGQIGSTCRCGNLHINEDLVFIELYDKNGQPVDRPGPVGTRMLLTNLINTAQPLIRYEMNDLIQLGESCPCGSSFRVIDKVLGRNDDVLYLSNKNNILQPVYPDLVSRWIITTSDSIREFRVSQISHSKLEITIDVLDSTGEAKAAVAERLRDRLTSELSSYGIDADVGIRVDAIRLPETMAKYKRFIGLAPEFTDGSSSS